MSNMWRVIVAVLICGVVCNKIPKSLRTKTPKYRQIL